jgi:hypothetical protein
MSAGKFIGHKEKPCRVDDPSNSNPANVVSLGQYVKGSNLESMCENNPSCIGMDIKPDSNNRIMARMFRNTSIGIAIDEPSGACIIKKLPLKSKCAMNEACFSGICDNRVCVDSINQIKYSESNVPTMQISNDYNPLQIWLIILVIIGIIVAGYFAYKSRKSAFGRRRR